MKYWHKFKKHMLATHPAHFSAFLWKSFNRNDRDQVLWARETEHASQTVVFTKTAGRHNLAQVFVVVNLAAY